MVLFLLIFAGAVGILMLAQSLDIECEHPQPRRRYFKKHATPAPRLEGLLRQY